MMIGAPFSGIRVVQSDNALAETTERLFPASRHRSARIRKKLIQRHGSEFRKVPTAYELPDGSLVCHPVVFREIEEHTRRRCGEQNRDLGIAAAVQTIADGTLTQASLLKTLEKIQSQKPSRNMFQWSIYHNPLSFDPVASEWHEWPASLKN